MHYNSFEHAHKTLNIKGDPERIINCDSAKGVTSLKLIEHNRSYNKILQKGRVIKFIGKGLLINPGHPISNQQWSSQEPFLTCWKKSYSIPVMYKSDEGVVKYMGDYKINDIQKKHSYEGFTYFQVVLFRTNDHPEINLDIFEHYNASKRY